MLLYFKASNFLSYQDIYFSMIAGSYNDHPENIVHLERYGVDVLKSAMVYGANASGKSNFLKALVWSVWFVRKSFATDTTLPAFVNENHENNLTKPISFTYGLLVDQTYFEYFFSIDNEKILEEELSEYRSQKPIQHFHRKYDTNKNGYDWVFSKRFSGEKETVKNITNVQTLFLTIGSQTNLPIAEKVFRWFNEDLLWSIDNISPGSINIDHTLKGMKHDQAFKEAILKEIKNADFFIDDLILKEDNDKKLKAYSIRTVTDEFGKEREIMFDLDAQESVGTKRFIAWIGPWIDILNHGKVVLIDELNNSLHTLLLQYLIKKFHTDNHTGAQLIFTTHDTNLMTQELFRRDQIWIVDRNKEGDSQLSPLSDFKIKKGKVLENSYLQGVYGGIPHIQYDN